MQKQAIHYKHSMNSYVINFSPSSLILLFQHNTFTRKLIQILDIDDDTLLNVPALSTVSPADRQNVLQQRQRTTEILLQKIEVIRRRVFPFERNFRFVDAS